MLPNLLLYKSDIEKSGAKVVWKGLAYHLPFSCVSSAVVCYPGSNVSFQVRFECFKDGTAALVSERDSIELAEVFFNRVAVEQEKHIVNRRILQSIVLLLVIVAFIVFWKLLTITQARSVNFIAGTISTVFCSLPILFSPQFFSMLRRW